MPPRIYKPPAPAAAPAIINNINNSTNNTSNNDIKAGEQEKTDLWEEEDGEKHSTQIRSYRSAQKRMKEPLLQQAKAALPKKSKNINPNIGLIGDNKDKREASPLIKPCTSATKQESRKVAAAAETSADSVTPQPIEAPLNQEEHPNIAFKLVSTLVQTSLQPMEKSENKFVPEERLVKQISQLNVSSNRDKLFDLSQEEKFLVESKSAEVRLDDSLLGLMPSQSMHCILPENGGPDSPDPTPPGRQQLPRTSSSNLANPEQLFEQKLHEMNQQNQQEIFRSSAVIQKLTNFPEFLPTASSCLSAEAPLTAAAPPMVDLHIPGAFPLTAPQFSPLREGIAIVAERAGIAITQELLELPLINLAEPIEALENAEMQLEIQEAQQQFGLTEILSSQAELMEDSTLQQQQTALFPEGSAQPAAALIPPLRACTLSDFLPLVSTFPPQILTENRDFSAVLAEFLEGSMLEKGAALQRSVKQLDLTPNQLEIACKVISSDFSKLYTVKIAFLGSGALNSQQFHCDCPYFGNNNAGNRQNDGAQVHRVAPCKHIAALLVVLLKVWPQFQREKAKITCNISAHPATPQKTKT
jgi:hypothetical protein